jgi:phytoene dehydrogenase-like protein
VTKKGRKRPQVVVIGAGISGLTAAAYLARAGHAVTVFEQFQDTGGVTATIRQDGFGWDLGPLLLEGFAPNERAGRILAELGIADQVPLQISDRTYIFPEFNLHRPEAYEGPLWRRERLKQLFPSEKDGIDRYYRFYNRMMNVATLNTRAELARGPLKAWLRLRLWASFNRVKDKQDWSAEKLMSHFFVDPRLKAIFTSILADLVIPPSRFAGLGIPMLNAENAYDYRIPRRLSSAGKRPSYHFIKGGCGTLVEAMAGVIREHGGKIYTSATVAKILVDADRVTGVVLTSGQTETADIIIATGGARETFFHTVGREYLPSGFAYQIDELPLMESVLMVQLGIDLDPRDYQSDALSYYYATYDIESAVSACRRGHYHEGRDGFVMYVPTLHSPGMAPADRHALTIYTIAPNELSEGTWPRRRQELADKLIEQAERVIPDLRHHIETQVILTPEDFRIRTHQQHHAFGGRAPVMGQDGPDYETPISGLWFVGSQSKSGGGVQNVMAGAQEAARRIIGHWKTHHRSSIPR